MKRTDEKETDEDGNVNPEDVTETREVAHRKRVIKSISERDISVLIPNETSCTLGTKSHTAHDEYIGKLEAIVRNYDDDRTSMILAKALAIKERDFQRLKSWALRASAVMKKYRVREEGRL